MDCYREDVGKLYALNGRNDLARYADWSTYTGESIPGPPTSCPSIPGLRLCGGACGGCPDPDHEACVGRSPLHPYSLCVDRFGSSSVNKPETCARGAGFACQIFGQNLKCLTFKVDAAGQADADRFSMCVDPAICAAAEAGYPGGAFCTGGK